MMNVLEINSLASIQDLGRFGYRKLGIGHCGAMDGLALQAGNLLLKNVADAPALELPLSGITVSFEQDTPFCITGAFYEAYLDNTPIYSYWRYTAKRGQVLQLVRAKIGMYGYLCVKGGFDVPKILGSCSTDLRANFGGFEGRALQKGDRVPTACKGETMSTIGIAPIDLRDTIYVLPSSEYDEFTKKSQCDWWQRKWTLQSNSNRMGYRFNGEPLVLKKPLEMLSHAIQAGTVQVPPNGQPIVLLADAQTTGGYPKIACVVSADLGRLAQVRFGADIQFRIADNALAQKLRKQNEVYLNQIRRIADENP